LPRWSLPIIGRLESDQARFSDLLLSLAPVTSRALSLNLKQMIDGQVVLREVRSGYPPSALYGLAERGDALMRCLLF
jgi:DNA-binding HxlR family transcriptional regulator